MGGAYRHLHPAASSLERILDENRGRTRGIDLQAWPITELTSDGNHLAAISASKISIVEATGDHGVVKIGEMAGAVSGDADLWMGLAVIGEDGLHIFKPMETLREIPRRISGGPSR